MKQHWDRFCHLLTVGLLVSGARSRTTLVSHSLTTHRRQRGMKQHWDRFCHLLTVGLLVSVGRRPQEERTQEVWRPGSARQIPEVLPLKDGKIYPNAASSPFVFYGLLNYGSLGCDVSEKKK